MAQFFNKSNRLQLLIPVLNQIHKVQAQTNRPLRILDVGCGTGMHAHYLASLGHQVVAVEPLPEMIAEGQKSFNHSNLKFINDELPQLISLEGQQFDLIYSVAVFQYVQAEDRQAAMNRMINLFLPGGSLAIIWPPTITS